MTMDRPTCATCAAFDEAKNWCRRRPPDPRHGWPDVGADSWCLEHVAKVDEDHAEHLKAYEAIYRQAQSEKHYGKPYEEGAGYDFRSKVIDAHLAAGVSIDAAMRQADLAIIAEAIGRQPTQGPKPETPVAPTPSPEPDPQGL